MRGATRDIYTDEVIRKISTHTPHAGRDHCGGKAKEVEIGFLLTRPMRGATRTEKNKEK